MENTGQPVPATTDSESPNEIIEQPTTHNKHRKNEIAINNLKALLLLTGIYSLIYNQVQKNDAISSVDTESFKAKQASQNESLQEIPNTYQTAVFIVNEQRPVLKSELWK